MPDTVSCVIRTYNEAEHVGGLIQALQSQARTLGGLEIVVVDSGSTDSTVEIVSNYGVNLVEIPKREFNYSKALNLGIEHSRGDLLLIMSAHAMPCQDEWLQRMLSHLKNDSVAGVYCRQVPWPGADWREVSRIAGTFSSKSEVFCKNGLDQEISFSNAASCIRRTLWEKHPFVIMPAAEDREWASWAVRNGYTIVYEAGVQVYHSHNDSCRKAAQRRIEVEKGRDIKRARKRNMFLTWKQAAGWVYKDTRQIMSLKNTNWKRAKLIRDCLACGYWYVMDFNHRS
jgi:rhamnosyltransferase